MKFLLIVLGIRFVIGAITRKDNDVNDRNDMTGNNNVIHPAEYLMR